MFFYFNCRGTNTITSGAITAQGAITATDQTLAIGAITTSADLTISKNAAKIVHSGTTSLTIESTDQAVLIEGVTFAGDDVSGIDTLSCGAITTTGALDVGFLYL